MPNTSHTENEILSQPEAWAQALDTVSNQSGALNELFQRNYEQIIFTGCGSTYYLSIAAAALYRSLTGQPAQAAPAGDLLLNPGVYLSQRARTLLVAVSRSGATTETLRAIERFRSLTRGAVLAITNYGQSPMAAQGDLALVIPKGQEQSAAQTRSFASMYVAACGVCSLAAGQPELLDALRRLPETGQRLMTQFGLAARVVGADLDIARIYYLGSGLLYGLACEVNLKMKEMTLTDSEPFHFLEFRHGPMSMVTPQTLLIGLLSEANLRHERQVLDEMALLGGRIFSLGETSADVSFESRLPEALRGVLYLPALQLMALERAYAKGLDPDHPAHLTPVIHLDTLEGDA
jgi:glucosamine--fructose-6-phosphate aminotransferase (isomerizing)